MWIELSRPSIFSKTLRCRSNAIAPETHTFSYAKHRMEVTTNSGIAIVTDGWRHLTIGDDTLRVKRSLLRMLELASGVEKLSLEWVDNGIDVVQISRTTKGECYLVSHDTSLLGAMFLTKVRIEQRSGTFDFLMAVACLAFFWTFHENHRRTSSA